MAEVDVIRFRQVAGWLQELLPSPVNLDRVSLRLGLPAHRPGVVGTRCQVCAPAADSDYRRVASSVPGIIVIDPDYYEMGTASGIALVAHEMYHQWQLQNFPWIMGVYDQEEAKRTRAGLSPWYNKYEYPAYWFEAVVYELALRQGLTPGNHHPALSVPSDWTEMELLEALRGIPDAPELMDAVLPKETMRAQKPFPLMPVIVSVTVMGLVLLSLGR